MLPRSQVPEGVREGDELEVFLYKDSEDRMIATRRKPKLMLHQVGYLTVLQVGRIGAFLDWGLDKDLLLPFHEQPRERVKEGQEVLVAVYLDKSERLCATMNVYPYLSKESPYRTGDQVTGIVYETSRNFGAFVEKAPLQMDRDMDRIINRMQANGGLLPFNDRVAPEIIRDEMQMSKNEFKRAVGHLLKLGKIEIGPDAIRMK